MPWIVVLLRSFVFLIFEHVPLSVGGQKDFHVTCHRKYQRFPVQLKDNNLMFAYAIQNITNSGIGGGGVRGHVPPENFFLKNRCFLTKSLVYFLYRKHYISKQVFNVTYPALSDNVHN